MIGARRIGGSRCAPGRGVGFVLGVTTVALVLAGCSLDGPDSPSSLALAPAAGEAMPMPADPGGPVRPQRSGLGSILVDEDGRTVYTYTNDMNGVSTCTGGCAVNWPIVPAPSPLPTSVPGVTATIGQTTRSDGEQQLTIDDRPAYTFAGDSVPGETNGQGKVLEGGVFTVVRAIGRSGTTPVGDPGSGSSNSSE